MTTMVMMTTMMMMDDDAAAAAAAADDRFIVIRLHYDYDCGADQDLGLRYAYLCKMTVLA